MLLTNVEHLLDPSFKLLFEPIYESHQKSDLLLMNHRPAISDEVQDMEIQ